MSSRADFGILLGLAFQTFSDELRQSLHARGFDDLGRSYGYFFRALADGPLRLHELSPGLGITNQGAMKIVDEMADRGYLERRPDPEDGRAKLISLAPPWTGGPFGGSALSRSLRAPATTDTRGDARRHHPPRPRSAGRDERRRSSEGAPQGHLNGLDPRPCPQGTEISPARRCVGAACVIRERSIGNVIVYTHFRIYIFNF
jgi:hypothetical protein